MSYEAIIYDVRDRVATITLNRPEVLNAWSPTMGNEFMDALSTANADDDVGCLIITGAGRGFCSGADVKGFREQAEAARSSEESIGGLGALASVGAQGVKELMMLGKPIIAAVNGPAVGIGCTVTLPCDIRIASEAARFGLIFLRVALVPEFGSSYLLPRIIGLAKANELVYTTRIIDAKEALEIGLVNRVVPADSLIEEATELARQIADGPSLALKKAKENFLRSYESSFEECWAREGQSLAECFRSEDHMEGIMAFLEKRKPDFHRK